MVKFAITLLCWAGLSVFFHSAIAGDGSDLLPPEKAYVLSARIVSDDRAELTWDIANGYYLYRSKFKFSSASPDIVVGAAEFPTGEKKHDEFFGEMEIYRGHVVIGLPLNRRDQTVKHVDLLVVSQGCADAGVCYPPYKQNIGLNWPDQGVEGVSSGKPDELSKLNLTPKRTSTGINQDELLPPDQAFQFIAEVRDPSTIHVSWQIAQGYYLYRDRFHFELLEADGVHLGQPDIPRGESKQEEGGPVAIFHRQVEFDLPLKRTYLGAVGVKFRAKFQGCSEKGVCYPVMDKTVALDLPAVSADDGAQHMTMATQALAEQDRIADSLRTDSVWLVAATFLGFGLLMAFSPCIFPMIPILSGIIAGQGEHITTGRAFVLSLVYVLAGAVTYTAFGVLAGLFGGNLQAVFQEPWVIAAFSAVFVVLSLSMFGFYEMQMPAFIQERVAEISRRQKGGTLIGVAVMGALSALIVGPCMAAPLAGALIYIGQTGDAVLGGLALFAMGLGMGVPLVIIGTSAGKLLPKAGIWMVAVKSVFGVGLLAVAVGLIERIVPPAVTLFLWALLLIIPSIYLGALDALPANASGWRKFWKGLGVVMLVYGVLLLVGVASNQADPLQPLRGITTSAPASLSGEVSQFVRVRNVADLEAQLADAKTNGQRVMLDYYADWCVSCKEMDRYTFGDPRVKAALADVKLLRADVTDNNSDDAALLSRYGLIGPPAVLFFGPDGMERGASRLIGDLKADAFLDHLKEALK